MNRKCSLSLRGLAVTSLCVVSVACAPTREIVDASGDKESEEFVRSIQGESVTVSLRDGSTYAGEVAESGPETLAVLVKSGRAMKCVPLSDVESVRVRRSEFPYIVGGVLIGGGIGAVVGAGMGHSSPSPGLGGNMFHDMSGAGALVGGAIGVLAGVVAGHALGASASETQYVLDHDSVEPEPQVTIVVPRLESEDNIAIVVCWNGRLEWLPKARIAVHMVPEGLAISMPQSLRSTLK